ncbi:MAG: PIN domain-containing protein [Candidatus Aminicenantes bacterium]|nr:PIN domain-containing protein [Candidatus Aminicenantes bacterium]
MEYLADTVAVLRYLARIGRIGKEAREILKATDEGENLIYISVISMVEIMYLTEANKIPVDFNSIKEKILRSDNYRIIDLSMEIVGIAKENKGLELHDRLIVATGIYLGTPILTCDKAIVDSNSIEVIWK